ncbi:MAG: beta-lactamase family protein [Propionibacterium sp.]|nr:beta-lactamase family protein [Propionibacterium sp.]HMQ36685.1 serine hydrolase domain-containing protein [Micropruina sp.]
MELDTDTLVAVATENHFTGAVRVETGEECLFEAAFGMADRAHGIPNTPQTRFGMASGSKTFTALAVLSLVADGVMALDDPVRRWLGDDLPQLDDAVTLRQLLSHTSGVGEYLDDDAEGDVYLLPGSMHTYTSPEDFVALLDLPMLAAPGSRFEYNNGGFVLLGLAAQRASGTRYQDLVRERVLRPAGLEHTDFLRSDELPGSAALGYLYPDSLRTNVFHLPIEGSGDGGAYTTVGDARRFWLALAAGAIVPIELVEQMTTPGSPHDPDWPYGLGLWLPTPGGVWAMVGADAGVEMKSEHVPALDLTWTVIANETEKAWPLMRHLRLWREALVTA